MCQEMRNKGRSCTCKGSCGAFDPNLTAREAMDSVQQREYT